MVVSLLPNLDTRSLVEPRRSQKAFGHEAQCFKQLLKDNLVDPRILDTVDDYQRLAVRINLRLFYTGRWGGFGA